jgi:hypothetical protein
LLSSLQYDNENKNSAKRAGPGQACKENNERQYVRASKIKKTSIKTTLTNPYSSPLVLHVSLLLLFFSDEQEKKGTRPKKLARGFPNRSTRNIVFGQIVR